VWISWSLASPKFWVDYYTLIYTCLWELVKSLGIYGSLLSCYLWWRCYLHLPLGVGEVIGYLWQLVELLFVMKMMVWHFVSNPHKVIDLWLYSWSCYLQTVVVQISLQSHRYDFSFWLDSQSSLEFSGLYDHVKNSIYGMDCRDMESNDLTGPFPAELIWGFQNLQLV